MKIPRRVAQVRRDDAVLLFPHGPAILPLNPGSLVSLLDPAGLVDDPNRFGMSMLLGDDFHHALSHPVVVPNQMRQELLKRSHRNARHQGHRLDALARQVRKLTPHINREMGPGVPSLETIREPIQVLHQHRFQPANLFGIHAWLSRTRFVKIGRLTDSDKQHNSKLAL
jgi:hypothetical protein